MVLLHNLIMAINQVWAHSLKELDSKNVEDILGNLKLLKSETLPDIFFNNVAVLYEGAGRFEISRIFYLKSIGENFFNIGAWKNFFLISSQTEFEINSMITSLYLLQSNFFIKLLFLLFLTLTIYWLFNFINEEISLQKMVTCISLSTVLFFTGFYFNKKELFVGVSKEAVVHEGPSVIFSTNKKKSQGNIFLKVKENNGFIKLFDNNKNPKFFWIKKSKLFIL